MSLQAVANVLAVGENEAAQADSGTYKHSEVETRHTGGVDRRAFAVITHAKALYWSQLMQGTGAQGPQAQYSTGHGGTGV